MIRTHIPKKHLDVEIGMDQNAQVESEMSNIVPLPIPEPSCGDCDSAYLGPQGVFCLTFNELIFDERVAKECPMFEPVPGRRAGNKAQEAQEATKTAKGGNAVSDAISSAPGPYRGCTGQSGSKSEPPGMITSCAPASGLGADDMADMIPSLTPLSTNENGRINKMADAELQQMCERYLSEMKSTLFGQSFEIHSAKGKMEAAKWLAKHIMGVYGEVPTTKEIRV